MERQQARLQVAPALTADAPFYRFSRYLRSRFPWRTYKVALHAGFTCPNLDGAVAHGGCTYCDNRSFSPALAIGGADIATQLAVGKERLRQRFRAERFIAYFQSYTNTYGPLDRLQAAYAPALADPEIVALAIGTRPDCVPEPVLDLLDGYADEREVWVEYGMQSAHDRTQRATNRGHTLAQFVDALERTAARPRLKVCVHVILGLPGETADDMRYTMDVLADLPFDSIKLHHLYVARGTALARTLADGAVDVLTLDAYIPRLADALERLRPSVSIQRLVGELNHDSVLAPRWGRTKDQIERLLIDELARRGTRQGSALATGAPH